VSEEEISGWSRLTCGLLGPDRWLLGLFLLFVTSLGGVAVFILFRDGNARVLPLALAAAAFLWGLERLETRYTAGDTRKWHVPEGCLAPVVIISLAAFAACFPTLKIYFIDDDFAYLHHFHIVSLTHFLQLFYTDIAQLVWRDPRQELRPIYGLYFMASYQLWGLHPLGYHLTTVLLHIMNSFLVFLTVKELAPHGSRIAIFAALLFAVLPLHSEVFFWATGAPAEVLPAFFYLLAFLCFMRFRTTGSARYLVTTVLSFAACLSSKESALTLPVMLAAYELFRNPTAGRAFSAGDDHGGKKRWWKLILGCLPFAVLLLAYLELRRHATGDYLFRASPLGNVREAVSSPAGFWLHLSHFGTRLWKLQSFNLRYLLLPYPAAILGIVLGLYLVWVYSLLKHRWSCRESRAPILFFGAVWYLISNVPLLMPDLGISHLYLPALGPCIATAFLAFPDCKKPQQVPGNVRILGVGLLVFLSASQLHQGNSAWMRRGELSAKMTAGLQAAIGELPNRTLVIVPPLTAVRDAMDGALPYLLQEPFRPVDLYSRVRLIEDPIIYCCPWWGKTNLALVAELEGPPDEPVESYLFSWDEQSHSPQRRKRVLPRRLLRDCVTRLLGSPVEAVASVPFARAEKLVEALATLVSEGSCTLVRK
jgi:hypothetical protein